MSPTAVCHRKLAKRLMILAERKSWLGGRDSNPDNVVQSHVSYRWTTSQYQPCLTGELAIIANRKPDRQARRLALGRCRPMSPSILVPHHLLGLPRGAHLVALLLLF